MAAWVVLQWMAEPEPTRAQATPAAPAVSIVFVIDSSPNMFPAIGDDFFEMAREGIVKFLELPGFPDDGRFEISVLQYGDIPNGGPEWPGYIQGAPGYEGTFHWFGPVRPSSVSEIQQTIDLVQKMQPATHYSASLLENGIREATELLVNDSDGDEDTNYHIVLVGTGEYRLPDPCPPDCYTSPEGPGCSWGGSNCDAVVFGCAEPRNCNRACVVRYWLKRARESVEIPGPVRFSAVHVGPEWRYTQLICGSAGGSELEDDWAYDAEGTPDYCPYPVPEVPSRGGFLQELAAVGCSAQGDPTPGGYVRVYPPVMFSCGSEPEGCPAPGSAQDIADAVARWLCGWHGGADTDEPQGDGVPELCDNCPERYNEDQRDCDGDGVGDVCQLEGLHGESCGASPVDTDGDGLCNELDTCDGGDDCLAQYWRRRAGCGEESVTGVCSCDCDSNEVPDFCQAAQETCGGAQSCLANGLTGRGQGTPECAQGPEPTCSPAPAACGPNEAHEWVLDLTTYPGALNNPAAALSWLEGQGWRLSDAGANESLRFMSDGTGFALELDGAAALDENDQPIEWSLLSPGFVPPPIPSCYPAYKSNCQPSNAPYIGDWSFVAIEVDLAVDNGGAAYCDSGGKTWDLHVWDVCSTGGPAARARLRFACNGSNGDEGMILIEQADGSFTQFNPLYTQGAPFTLILYIDNTQAFDIDGQGCGLVYDPDGSVSASLRLGEGSEVARSHDARTFPELTDGQPWRHRGIRLELVSGPESVDTTLKVKHVKIRPSNYCEMKFDSFCPAATPYCAGSGDHIWECTDGSSGWLNCSASDPRPQCVAYCGDGVVCPVETCDDWNRASLDGCDAACQQEIGIECGDGIPNSAYGEECDDGEDPLTGNSNLRPNACREDCTAPRCGDHVIDSGEECDDGLDPSNGNSYCRDSACRPGCLLPSCGDGVWDWEHSGVEPDYSEPPDEECDPGPPPACCIAEEDPLCMGYVQRFNGNCSSLCTCSCGDGARCGDEECDGDDVDGGFVCDEYCVRHPYQGGESTGMCGDGAIDAGEECDDGAENSDTAPDACRVNCTVPACGDDVVDTGEECDDGANNSDTLPDSCRTNCVEFYCGDGVKDWNEQCDDGNTIFGDGCSPACQSGGGGSQGPEKTKVEPRREKGGERPR
jgi:cysteine-rich repeat protein